jgi:hypothetical protein
MGKLFPGEKHAYEKIRDTLMGYREEGARKGIVLDEVIKKYFNKEMFDSLARNEALLRLMNLYLAENTVMGIGLTET